MAVTRIVSWSEIDKFRQCPLAHELAYKQRWSKPPEEGSALSRGSLFHRVMEAHFNSLRLVQGASTLPEESLALEASISEMLAIGSEDQTDEQNLVAWMYDGYLQMYGDDAEWEILEVEGAHEFWLPTERGTRSSFKLKMKLDLLVKHKRTGKLWIVDHKSGKDLPNDKMLELNDQFGLYLWGLRQSGLDVTGAIHNAVRTQRNKGPMALEDRFKRSMLYRTEWEIDTIAVEAYKTVKRAYAIKAGEAERATNEDTCRWRCNFTEDCLGARKQAPSEQYPYLVRSLGLHGFVVDLTRH